MSPSIPVRSERFVLCFLGSGRYTGLRMVRRWSRAKVKWEVSSDRIMARHRANFKRLSRDPGRGPAPSRWNPLIRLIFVQPRGIIASRWGGPRLAGMIGTSIAFSIERGDIPAMQNSADLGPQPMLNGILVNQLSGGSESKPSQNTEAA